MKNALVKRAQKVSKAPYVWGLVGVAALAVGYLAYSFYPEAARTIKMHRM